MTRKFVDLTPCYPAGHRPTCAILNTTTDSFVEAPEVFRTVLFSLEMVRAAAGDEGVSLVPPGFFERRTRPAPEAETPDAVTVSLVIWEAIRTGQSVDAERPEELSQLRGVTAYLDESLVAREWYRGRPRPGT